MNLKGLTDQQVKESREKNGTNSLTEKERESFLDKLKDNLGDPMIKILIFALIISSIFAFLGKADWIETLGILFAISATTYISTWSEYRNENTFAKLQEEASRIMVKVMRNGVLTEIKIDDLVVGDIIKLQNGDKIPADGIMREGEISVDQSSLNGESKECHKYATEETFILSTPVNFLHKNNVYRGSTVTNGSGYMEVTVVGDKSVYGQIASELQLNEERDSPLKLKLSHLADKISKFGHCGGILISIAYLFKKIIINNQFNLSAILYYCGDYMRLFNDILQAVMFAVIIIVMAVPEGLPLMIAIVSSQNMRKMLKDNVLVKTITGIETAGSLNIIFSDKTGTITKGKLEVVEFLTGELKSFKFYKDLAYNKLRHLLFLNINHNTDSQFSNGKCIGGNITEKALMDFIEHYESDHTRIKMNPFNSQDKYSSCLLEKDNQTIVMFKGAPEKLLEHCNTYTDEYGNMHKINKEILNNKIDELAKKSIRVLALAYKNNENLLDINFHNDLSLIGLVAIKDDVRQEAVEAIKECHSSGIQVVMVTGDRIETAVAIAKEAKLITDDKHISITSNEMSKLSDEELKKMIPNLRVVARALPSDKSRLVRLAQELNLVTGMTGDGTNDAPALKKADVGFAMGSGTEVAKEAGDIVILDDNFKSIANAVLYGRTIFENIRKFIMFQLTINISAVAISFLSPLLNIEEPLSITQILWINLIMDTLAALAFGGEPALKSYMKQKPKRRDENIINKYMLSSILTTSIYTVLISVLFLKSNYYNMIFDNSDRIKTGYFALFVFIAIFNAFNTRTESVELLKNIKRNKMFIFMMILITVTQILMLQFGGRIMHCYSLNETQLAFAVVLAMVVIPLDLIKKLILNIKK